MKDSSQRLVRQIIVNTAVFLTIAIFFSIFFEQASIHFLVAVFVLAPTFAFVQVGIESNLEELHEEERPSKAAHELSSIHTALRHIECALTKNTPRYQLLEQRIQFESQNAYMRSKIPSGCLRAYEIAQKYFQELEKRRAVGLSFIQKRPATKIESIQQLLEKDYAIYLDNYRNDPAEPPVPAENIAKHLANLLAEATAYLPERRIG